MLINGYFLARLARWRQDWNGKMAFFMCSLSIARCNTLFILLCRCSMLVYGSPLPLNISTVFCMLFDASLWSFIDGNLLEILNARLPEDHLSEDIMQVAGTFNSLIAPFLAAFYHCGFHSAHMPKSFWDCSSKSRSSTSSASRGVPYYWR